MMECMGAFEKFLHREHEELPILVKAALVHVQFETIHPFLDRNGRLGRLLITFLLCVAGAIREPILYLNLYFKTNRQKYYELLDRVRSHGDWETWLEFFLTGVKETAQQAADTSKEILTLIEEDRRKIEELGRPLHPFCAFTSTFSANRSSRSRRQPSSSPSLRPLWRRLYSTW
jgi:Fic family protein